jgi:hypothetical protein
MDPEQRQSNRTWPTSAAVLSAVNIERRKLSDAHIEFSRKNIAHSKFLPADKLVTGI